MINNIIKYALLVILIFVLSSCHLLDFLKEDEEEDKEAFTDFNNINEDNFMEVIESINLRLQSFVDKHQIINISDFEPYLSELLSEEWLEDVDLNDNALFMKVKNGGYIIWGDSGLGNGTGSEKGRSSSDLLLSDIENVSNHVNSNLAKISNMQHVDRLLNLSSNIRITNAEAPTIEHSSATIGTTKQPRSVKEADLMYGCNNKRVLIANVTDGEVRVKDTANDLEQIDAFFKSYYNLYNVDYKKGSEVTVDFLKNNLTDYGLIFLVAHGILSKKFCATYVKTGSKALRFLDENKCYYKDWKEDKLALVGHLMDLDRGEAYWAVSPFFFNYIEGDFEDNSIMVTGICDALTLDINMGNILLSKGLGAFIGFTGETRCLYVSDALGCIINMFPNQERPYSIGLKQSFDEINGSPYKYLDNGNVKFAEMLLKSKSDNIALFSTISEAKEVNLGLPWNWASANLGADNPSESGDFHIIGKYDSPKEIHTGNICGKKEIDIVTQIMGNDWQLPPASYYAYIMPSDFVKWDFGFTYKATRGARVTGPSGESIFIPYYGHYEVNDRFHNSYPDKPYDKNYSTTLPFGQIEWYEKGKGAHIYIFSPSRFRYNVECGGIRTEIGECNDYSYDFHSCRLNVRGVRPNPFYKDSVREDFDVSNIQNWCKSFR